MKCQKSLFSLPEDMHYINCAYMSPLLKRVEKAGIDGLIKKRNPAHIKPSDFFNEAVEVRALFAKLVNAPSERIALIPSVSYGMGVVIQNVRLKKGGKVITVQEEFPSNVNSLYRICQEQGLELVPVPPPAGLKERGKTWNERLLEAITANTVMVNLSPVHWAEGTLFDMEAIGKRAKEVGALFIVDGTQAVGAMDFDIKKCQVDALICAGYKWLLGPYTSGCAYFGEYFDGGKPLEETWLNRIGSENFRSLVCYQPDYREGAFRYNMGEFSNFINLPMLREALTQILEWTPAAIQQYCSALVQPLIAHLKVNGFWVEDEKYRAKHLIGIRLPEQLKIESVEERLSQNKVIVSLRGHAVRLSPHVYNDDKDIEAMIASLKFG
jgi:selenocysteine lyase/cysteine desulfurase